MVKKTEQNSQKIIKSSYNSFVRRHFSPSHFSVNKDLLWQLNCVPSPLILMDAPEPRLLYLERCDVTAERRSHKVLA